MRLAAGGLGPILYHHRAIHDPAGLHKSRCGLEAALVANLNPCTDLLTERSELHRAGRPPFEPLRSPNYSLGNHSEHDNYG